MKALVVALGLAALLATAASGRPAQNAVETRSCAQAGAFFNVHIAGNKLGSYSARAQPELFAAIPAGKSMVAVWSYGSQTTSGPLLHGWVTSERSRLASRCRPSRSVAKPAVRALRPPFEVKDGWALSRRYECRQRGRFVIRTEDRASVTKLSVWMEQSREPIAIAEIVGKNASIRVSKSCAERTH